MTANFFILMFLLGANLFWITYVADNKKNAGIHVICGAFIGAIMGMFTIFDAEKNIPKAIDVYRNKTELEINYIIKNNDTISVDSLVVFKNTK